MNLAEIFFKSALQLVTQVQTFTWQKFQVAGFNIAISCLIPEMKKLIYPAFSHLQTKASSTDLKIYVVDQKNMPFPLKILGGYQTKLLSRGEIPHLSNHQITTFYNHHDGALNLIHLEKNIAIYWVRSIHHMPWWIAGSPLQRIIACWMRNQNLELTHAAAVANSNHAILLAGKSGAGKSTTTLSCIDSGLFYLSEDYCLVDFRNSPKVHNIYNSLKLEPTSLERFPKYAPYATNQNRASYEKALIFQNEIHPHLLKKQCPIKAIVSLEVGKQTSLKKCHPSINALALSASTIFQLSASMQTTLSRYKSLCLQLNCYQLTLGPNLKENVAQIQQLLLEELP